ncbi:CoA-binding protein [Arthrospira platensis BEA 1257B]|nr:CoA-binding protein [Limnospira indica PCC 8005]
MQNMLDLNQDDTAMAQVLAESQTIAVYGHSDKPSRPSYMVAEFLRNRGYRVYPVNPLLTEVNGQPCYPNLQAVPETIDIVNVFRGSQYLPEIVDEAIAVGAKTVWGQLGISHPEASQKALDAGLNLAMNICIKIEIERLHISKNR